ncbi:MAG: cupin domain-containing protein [Pseudomonadota bacterium]
MTVDCPALAQLIAPVEFETFIDEFWHRDLLVLDDCSVPFSGIVTAGEIDACIARDPPHLTLADAGSGEGRFSLSGPDGHIATLARFQQGATLILDHAQRQLPGLGRLCRRPEAELGYGCHANIYVTPPGGQGFPMHADKTGAFIMQIAGQKIWHVEQDGRERSYELRPGALAWLPKGMPHAARAGCGGSMHVTLAIAVPSWSSIAGAGGGALDEPLPPGFHRMSDDVLVERLSQIWEGDAEAAVSDALLSRAEVFSPDMSGRVTGALSTPEMTPETRLRPRDDIIWRLADVGDQVRLVCGPIRLLAPAKLASLLRQCLTRPVRIGDLSDAEPSEVAALVRSLLANGLVHCGDAGDDSGASS